MQNKENANENKKIENNHKQTGLANLGNTCFINSILQILLRIPDLNNLLDNTSYFEKLNNNLNSLVLLEWDLLRKEMLKETHDFLSPIKFIKIIHNVSRIKNINIFAGYYQNDIQEFLLFLIDCFHLALKHDVNITINGNPQTEQDEIALKCYSMVKKTYENDYSPFFNIFYGISISKISNLNGEILSITPETFSSIDLPLPSMETNKNPSLENCFDLFTSNETLEGDNMYFDEKLGQKIVAIKKIIFWSLPNILIIDLKRYNHRMMKLQQLLNFNLENLDLSKYVIGYNKNQYVYDLIGICNHSGGTSGGHYTSFVKDSNKNKWYYCNDTQVIEINDTSQLITPKAYCLFYKKK